MPRTACHDAELRHREQGREQRRDERPDERDVVQREGDDAPFHRELKPDGPCEDADEGAGREAHLRPHGHVFAELAGRVGARREKPRAASGAMTASHLALQVVDLHEAEDHVEERDEPEAQRRVDAAR